MTFLVGLTFVAFGMLWVHLTPNLQLANAAVGFSFTLLNLFCGYLKTKPTIPAGWIWVSAALCCVAVCRRRVRCVPPPRPPRHGL